MSPEEWKAALAASGLEIEEIEITSDDECADCGEDHNAEPSQVEMMATLNDHMNLLAESAAGHKRVLIEQGFSPEAAEQMAMAYYAKMLGQLFG